MTVRSAVRFAVAWGLCLAALAGFHFGYVRPQERAQAAGQHQIEAKNARFELLANAKSPREKQRLQTRQDELEAQYGAFVFTEEEIARLDFAIRETAEKDGLKDFSARPVGTTTALGTTKLKQLAQRELVLAFTGDFPSILRFINDLERRRPVVFVNQFTLRSGVGKTPGLTCDMECSVLYPAPGK
jgi:hypothetical protein